MNNYTKYIGWFLVIMALGGGGLWGVREYQSRNSPERQALRYFDDLKQKYENDTYGGETPEETLRLFIEALEKGDIELAIKYFVIEKQEKQKNYLLEIQKKDNFQMALADLARLKLSKKTEEEAFFTAVGKRGVVELQVILLKNLKTNKWKISEL